MANFTMRLHTVIDTTGGVLSRDEGGNTILTGGDIGLNFITPYLEAHKPILVGKIIDRFINQEIATETISMFQLAMRRKANEIMPYYNKMYESETFEFNPLHTIDIHTLAVGKELQNVTVLDKATSETENKSGSRTVQSELPQMMLSGSGDYASAGTDANTLSTGTSNAETDKVSDSETDNNTDTQVSGYQAYPANLIQQYRSIILNIDAMIVNEFEDCFMSVWLNGDDYNPRPTQGLLHFPIL